ncbi:MAG: permease [Planctomycetota bacterium]
MKWKDEWKKLAILVVAFLACFYLPVEYFQGWARLKNAVWESLYLTRWYAQEHVLLCLVPAFFIAGAIAVFVNQASVMKYLGARANKTLAYSVASISGTILAVCSCTVLPLFAGIYRMGAGLGPACAFLYSGPAINVLAIILTARVLGLELGVARAVGAIAFSIIIGLAMHFIFRKEEMEKANTQANAPESEISRPLWQNAVFFAVMIGVFVFANWSKPEETIGLWRAIHSIKWIITSIFAVALGLILIFWIKTPWFKVTLTAMLVAILAAFFGHTPMIPFVAAVVGLSWATSTTKGESGEWFNQSWSFAKQIMPLLLGGVLASGFLLGRPEHEGLIPSEWVISAVGGNSLFANFFASFAGAFMYFATLTEVPILQGLISSGMGQGPALALLLAGPVLSLPSMLALCGIMGIKKTVVFVLLVIVMATMTGMIYGAIFG